MAARRQAHPEQSADDIAAQKAERSRAYRSSQTLQNLLVALGVSLLGVLVLVFAVPRGTAPAAEAIDVASIASDAAAAYDHTVVVPDAPDSWLVNAAELEPSATVTWSVLYAPSGETGFIRFAQAFDADDAWAAQQLDGRAPTGTVTIDGREWDVYDLPGTNDSANLSYAIGAQVGDDHILISGATDPETARQLAELTGDQLDALATDGDSA